MQCRVQLSSCPDLIARFPVYLNILKYLSAFPPIWLTAYAGLGYTMPNLPLIITAFAAINSVYSFLVRFPDELVSAYALQTQCPDERSNGLRPVLPLYVVVQSLR